MSEKTVIINLFVNQNMFSDEIICSGSGNKSFDYCSDTCGGNISFYFDNNWTEETIVTKYDLLCEKETVVHNMNTLNLAGMLVGGLLFGNLSDM